MRKTVLMASVFLLVLAIPVISFVTYRLLREPKVDLINLIPGDPIFCATATDFADIAGKISGSPFGREIVNAPIARWFKTTYWWERLEWHLRFWKIDLEELHDIAGDRSMLAYYRDDRLLVASIVSSQGKIGITTSLMTTSDSKYRITRTKHRGITIITVGTGLPGEFSYAFAGKLGILSTDKNLLISAIDLYVMESSDFARRNPEAARALREPEFSFYYQFGDNFIISSNRRSGRSIISENTINTDSIQLPEDSENYDFPRIPDGVVMSLYLRSRYVNTIFMLPSRKMLPSFVAISSDEGFSLLESLLARNGLEIEYQGDRTEDDVSIRRFRLSGVPLLIFARADENGNVVTGNSVDGVKQIVHHLRHTEGNFYLDGDMHLWLDSQSFAMQSGSFGIVFSLLKSVMKTKETSILLGVIDSLYLLRYFGAFSIDADQDANRIKVKIRIEEGDKNV